MKKKDIKKVKRVLKKQAISGWSLTDDILRTALSPLIISNSLKGMKIDEKILETLEFLDCSIKQYDIIHIRRGSAIHGRIKKLIKEIKKNKKL